MLDYPYQDKYLFKVLTRSSFILLLVLASHSIFAQKKSEPQPNKEYSEAISVADKYLISGDYLQALNEYEKAWNLYQRETYPGLKIDQINKTLANTPLSRMLYEKAIRQGDSCFSAKDYKRANTEYYNALRLYPSAQYPKTKLSEVSKEFVDPENETRYRIILIHAGKAFDRADYYRAISFYQQALFIKPAEKWIEKKIEETNALKVKNTSEIDPYVRCLVESDNLMEQKKWKEARAGYIKASAMRPADNYPASKIVLLDHIQKLNSDEQNYLSLIVDADKFYKLQDYENAGIFYLQALKLKPDEQYPKSMLKKSNRVSLQQDESAKSYNAAVTNADILSLAGDFDAALVGFQRSITKTPEDNYVKSRIVELTKITEVDNINGDAYQTAINKGDRFLASANYSKALSEYRYASWQKSEEIYPKIKIEEVQNLMLLANKIQTEILRTNTSSEIVVSEKDITSISSIEPNADKRKPAQENTLQKNEEFNTRAVIRNETDIKYTNLVKSADTLFDSKEYDAAINSYKSALEIKPEEIYPKERIAECGNLLAQLQKQQKEYDIDIREADKLFSEKNYPSSLNAYQFALKIYPEKSYPLEQITACNAAIAELKTQKETYKNFIAYANKAFKGKQYSKAIDDYSAALAIKSDEKYPREQITACNAAMAELKTQKEKYENFVASADKAFNGKQYSKAIDDYSAALAIKSDEKYPGEQITACNAAMAELKTRQEKYENFIATADKAYNGKKYSNAIDDYSAALAIKSDEKYPLEQITACNAAMAESKTQKETYENLVASADKAFNEKKYSNAIDDYSAALAIKSDEKYPGKQIVKINSILEIQKPLPAAKNPVTASAVKASEAKEFSPIAEAGKNEPKLIPEAKITEEIKSSGKPVSNTQNADQEKYDKAIAFADKAFEDKNYPYAINGYTAALKIKSTEKYPQDKINAVKQIQQQQNTSLENYKRTILAADKALNEKDYTKAMTTYQTALKLNPAQKYPQEKIASINVIISQQEVRKEKYNNAITSADNAFDNKDFVTAITEYKTAAALSPAESYPKERIETISTLMSQQKVTNENYTKTIMAAEKAFAAKDYSTAISGFQSALNFKPDEVYPLQRITAINGIIALDKEKLNKQYTEYIGQADAHYSRQDFVVAQKEYKMASDLKPGEDYPRERYNQIATILITKAKETKETYEGAIADADKAYKLLIYDQAVMYYSKALEIKPGEIYPGQMIARIRKNMMDHALVEITAENFILKNDAERRFSFSPVNVNLRKNNYLVIRARISGKSQPKLFINYGNQSMKNGGVVLKNINSEILNDFVINISLQDKWFREDNNWLSLYSENGDLEVASIRISQAR